MKKTSILCHTIFRPLQIALDVLVEVLWDFIGHMNICIFNFVQRTTIVICTTPTNQSEKLSQPSCSLTTPSITPFHCKMISFLLPFYFLYALYSYVDCPIVSIEYNELGPGNHNSRTVYFLLWDHALRMYRSQSLVLKYMLLSEQVPSRHML